MRNLQIIETIILGVVSPAIIIVSELMVIAVLSAFVFWFNPKFFIFIALTMGGFTLIFYMLIKRRMHILGLRKMENKEKAILHINQGLGSIKEAIISGRESYFLHEFSAKQKNVALISFEEHVYIRTSNIYIETAMIVTVSAMIIIALTIGLQAELILTSLSIFAIVAVRMMPSANRISTQVSMLRNSAPALHEILADIKYGTRIIRAVTSPDAPEIKFDSEICLNAITFHYEGTTVNILENINLKINKNSMVGFAGASGTGKTTLIDIILGLLEPSSGVITVDGIDIKRNICGWQRKIGYIPQHIYICDDSIRKNIAFGIPEEKIDDNRLAEVITIAQLDSLIKQLPEGVNTIVGEHGARFSGGERQRIGIARALYHNPEVLVMDEATASLDNLTESAFTEAINTISGKITILIIAHRLTTLQHCDTIHFMQNGTIVSGSFQELLQNNPGFRQMAGNNPDNEKEHLNVQQ
jgi:ATP-binding cassette subfamily C protein